MLSHQKRFPGGGERPRATKIVATLGPASSDLDTLERMMRAGVDVVRMNFSHGTAEDHVKRAENVREASRRSGRTVGIMGATVPVPATTLFAMAYGIGTCVRFTRSAPYRNSH